MLFVILFFFASSVRQLQSLKAPWVDECYSYYGVWHDSFSEFYISMLTGINFSPPLYFLFNFCIQFVFPTSIEQLRLQSLFFTLIGIVLSFFLTRKIFGTTPALLATILVLSQSSLLLSQAQEARHYAMFFACSAWAMFMQSFGDGTSKKIKWLTFIAHFCLCQIHYLGIIFTLLCSGAYVVAYKQRIRLTINNPITISLIVSGVTYLFYLYNQQSILNTWSKPNQLSDLLGCYNDSLLILTISIPIVSLIIQKKRRLNTETKPTKKNYCSKPLIITSILWLSLPIIFWTLSRLTPLNLFVDRYFIPKEVSTIVLVAYGFSFIFQKSPIQKLENVPMFGTLGLSLVIILISTKRAAFGLNKDTNYHHSLIIDEYSNKTKQPIMLEGDHRYFPNAYLGDGEVVFDLKNSKFKKTYLKFSKKIQLIDTSAK